nr:bifunctional glutamine-synthetase adenylyltransferase/deadenyltransferase [Acidimicrobiia bacterium]
MEAPARLVALSRWAADRLVADPGAAAALADLDVAIDPAGAIDVDHLARCYEREMLRLAARDLGGIDDLTATTRAISTAAAALWEAALRLAGAPELAVIGMGKLGAGELNYASDVDVVLVAADPAGAEPAARRAAALVRHSVPVDLALRPGGGGGVLLRTVAGYVAHWERWAAPWERQALLKARPVAGDPALGAAWAEAAERALWDRPFGADDIRAIRAMKRRAEAEVARRGTSDRDLKRGLGGIRDIELAVQLLQLVHGRDDPALR